MHLVNSLLLDTVADILLGRPVDLIEDLQLGPASIFRLPLLNIERVERFRLVHEVAHIMPRYSHFFILIMTAEIMR